MRIVEKGGLPLKERRTMNGRERGGPSRGHISGPLLRRAAGFDWRARSFTPLQRRLTGAPHFGGEGRGEKKKGAQGRGLVFDNPTFKRAVFLATNVGGPGDLNTPGFVGNKWGGEKVGEGGEK